MKAVIDKRSSLESTDVDKETIYSQVLKSKGKTKVNPALEEKIERFIRGHPFLVASPIKDDSVLVPDPADPTKKLRKNKLLLQVSVRELHNDLLKEVPECTVDGNVLVSDWKLRRLLPPEVRRMSNYYKTMCACIVCVQMKLHQSTYNRFKGKLLKQLKQEVDSLRLGSRSRRIALDKYNG